jgi:hypothetical protein
MSISTVAQVRSSSKSTRSARTLLLVIASHVNPDTGWAWPSLATLARETAVTVQHVIRLIRGLEALGELEVRRGHGRGHVNFYRIREIPVEISTSKPRKSNISGEENLTFHRISWWQASTLRDPLEIVQVFLHVGSLAALTI